LRHVKRLAFAAGACGLAAATAVSGAVAATGSAVAAAGAPASGLAAASAMADITVHPDAVRLASDHSIAPQTLAQCEAEYHIACYDPAEIRQAYNLPTLYSDGITGKGTTIVIVDSFGSPTIKHDLGVFDSAFGLPAPPSFKIITPVGRLPKWNPKDSDMTGWGGETTLDVEWAHTIAPGANILLVETPVSETEGVQGFPQIVSAEEYVMKHYHPDVISQSFSATEQTFPSKASVNALRGANLMAEKDKVTMLAASGDSGAADVHLDGSTYYLFPVTSWSDSDPLVTGVGGTDLHLNTAGDRTSPDTAWNDTWNKNVNGTSEPTPSAGGGGKSILFSRPWYQDGVAAEVGDSRGVPDISMSGSGSGAVTTYSSFPGGGPAGWYPTWGTSEATPLFAGIVALASQYAGHSLGLINPALYEMSADDLPGIVPVTSGNNTVTFLQGGKEHTVQGWKARAGYSLAAGVGTVDALYFVPELAKLAG
jgi:subtilase family serine protease